MQGCWQAVELMPTQGPTQPVHRNARRGPPASSRPLAEQFVLGPRNTLEKHPQHHQPRGRAKTPPPRQPEKPEQRQSNKKTPRLVPSGQGDGDSQFAIAYPPRQRHIWCVTSDLDVMGFRTATSNRFNCHCSNGDVSWPQAPNSSTLISTL